MRVRKKILLFATSFIVAVVVLGVAVPSAPLVNAQAVVGPCQTDAQCGAGMKCVSNVCAPAGSSEAKVNSSAGTAETMISNIRLPVISFIIRAVLISVIYVLGMFVKLVAGLADVVLSFNKTILDFDPPFILIGWVFFRDIANLGFVFGIIVIAVATILRIQGYQAQRILLKLIAAALLVNFSLVLAGSIIRVSDVFSQFFLDKMTSGGTFSIGAKLTQGFQIAEITVKPDDTVYEKAKNFFTSLAGPGLFEVSALALTAVFLILMFLTLLAFSGMLFLRFLHLSFLLMISPLVWLLWIFPHTQNHWKKWWSTFLHWTFYAPIVLVFVWVSLTVIEKANTYAEQATQAINAAAGGFGKQLFDVAHVQLGTLMASLMAMSLLLGGMKMAQAMGYGGTALVMKSAQKMGGWAKTKATRGAARAGNWVYRKAGVEKAVTATAPKTWLGKQFAGRVQRGATALGAKMEEVAAGSMEDAKKKYGSYDKERLRRVSGTLTGPERNAVMSMLAEKEWLDDDTIQRLGGDREVLKLKEQFAGFGKAKDFEAVENAVGKTKEIQDAIDAFDDVAKAGGDTTASLERLKKAQEDFSKRLKDKDWRTLGKTTLGRAPTSNGDAQYQQLFANEIVGDPSGRKFYRAFAGVEGEKMHNYIETLVRQSDLGLFEVFGSELQSALDKGRNTSDYSELINTLELSKDKATLRLVKRLKDSVLDGVIGAAYAGPSPAALAPAPSPGPAVTPKTT